MNSKEKEFEVQLRQEGFSHVYVWQDRAGASYPDHSHPTLSAHIILEGELTLTMNGQTRAYRAGERCDVPAGIVHSAKMGQHGCRYTIRER